MKNKSRKYLEVEVVKEKKERCDDYVNCDSWCKKYCKLYIKQEKLNGNWINGENLDKIQFPVPCSYRSHTGKKRFALLLKDSNNGEYKYRLLRMSQDNGESIFLSFNSLKHSIRKWDIHILKAKIILFE